MEGYCSVDLEKEEAIIVGINKDNYFCTAIAQMGSVAIGQKWHKYWVINSGSVAL